tara:strand:+ start:130 stop:546 length:417 start_codon:yes stop_codon:yes gene_type:complete
MAHFAKIGLNSKVIGVHVVNNSDILNADGVEDESVGKKFLENQLGWPLWVQTSYNTKGGIHYTDGVESEDQETKALRKNYAGIGYIWDEDKDMFYQKQPYASWSLNDDTGKWNAPTPMPDDGKNYIWKESTLSWDEVV